MLGRKYRKIFVIGFNKTGTTSVKKLFLDHGFKVGNQAKGELLLKDYAQKNWSPIIRYCKSVEVFQDIPFSLPFTYVILDKEFPDSKFILTVRDNSDVWYNSLVRFHSRHFGNGKVPTAQDLRNAEYRYKGFLYESMKVIYGTPDDDLYNETMLKEIYIRHVNNVRSYFRGKNNLMEVDLSQEDSMKRLSKFLDFVPNYNDVPWENKSEEL